jgi:integrase
LIKIGKPLDVWKELIREYQIADVYTNGDYEPYAIRRDGSVGEMLAANKIGFKLFLLTGGRREEVVDLKWSDIYSTTQGVKLFIIDNKKVNRIKKDAVVRKKYIGINADLEDFLIELGMNEKIGTDEYILYPDRTCTTEKIMDDLSKGFTHYKEGAGITKNISLSNLRKTYLTWLHQILGDDTGLVSSHSNTQVLEKYYLDPKVLTAVEVSALKIRAFGKK